MTSLVSASQVVTGQVQSLDSVRAHALPSDAMIFASGTKVQPANQNLGSYGLVESANALTLTTTGSVPVVTQSPFADLYKEGSLSFSGTTGNYVSATATGLSTTQWNTTGMTVEAWVNYTTFAGAASQSGSSNQPNLLGFGGFSWQFGSNISGNASFYYWTNGTTPVTYMATTPLSTNTWNHITFTCTSSGTGYMFINGVQSQILTNTNGTISGPASTVSITGTPTLSGSTLYLNQNIGGTAGVSGYVADVRVVTGAALYTSGFTVPSAPLSTSATGVTQALIRAGQNSPTIQSGALTFDRGLKQFMNFGAQNFNIATRGFTAVFRYTWNGTATFYERIFQASQTKTDQNNSIYIARNASSAQLVGQFLSGGSFLSAATTGTLSQGVQYTVAFVYNPNVGGGTAQFWVNGAPSGSAATGITPPDLAAAFTFVGCDYSGGTISSVPPTNASMNTFAVYNRALSNVEILNAYSALTTSTVNAPIEIGDSNGTPALSIAGDGRVNVTKLGQTSNVLPWPPAAMTGYVTSLNGGTYLASSSADSVTYNFTYSAFDKSNSTYWSPLNGTYTGAVPYSGTVTTTDVNGTQYRGEWLQLQLPSQIYQSYYTIYAASYNNTPTAWAILGSNDGVNWFLVDTRTGVSWASAPTTQTFTLSTPSTKSYSYFRMVVNVSGTIAQGVGVYSVVYELIYYGTADTAQTLTVSQPVTLSYGAQTASLTGISGDKYVPQDFSSSGLNIPAYVVSNTATVANTVQYSSFGPFAGEGSFQFPGGSATGILFPPSVTQVNPFTGGIPDFTFECWIYQTVATGTTGTGSGIIVNRGTITGYQDWVITTYNSSGTNILLFNMFQTGGGNTAAFGPTIPLNQWVHIAVTLRSGAGTAFVNGVAGTPTGSIGSMRYASTSSTIIGNGAQPFNGYIASARIVSGLSLYTGNFTPSTQPLTAIQGVTQSGQPYGTVLLLRNAPAPGRVLTSKFAGSNSTSVLPFPPAAMTTYATTLNAGYGQGVYVASASSEFDTTTNAVWRVFDKSTSGYSSGFNTYVSGAQGGYFTTSDINGTVYQGDWVQIQMPTSIVLSNYSIAGVSTGYLPNKFWILGSRDGTNWNLVDSRTGVTNWPSSAGYLNFNTSASAAFTYFRIVMFSVQNSGAYAQLGELVFNGTIEGPNVTPDGRLGLGVSNPVQALEVAGSAVVAGTLSAGNPLMFRNRIINGDMAIAQRGTSTALVNQTLGYSTDRFFAYYSFTGGALTTYQNTLSVTDAPYQQGLLYSTNVTCTSTLSGTAGGAYLSGQVVEGFNARDFGWGTSFGSPVTMSFWFKSGSTGYTSASIRNKSTYNYSFTSPQLTYSTAGVWQYYTVTIPPPPSGSAWGSGTASFAEVIINGFQSGVSATGWNNSASMGYSGMIAPFTAGNYVAYTGVQLEKGSVATPFEVRPYGIELSLCQRYYEQSYEIGTAPGTNTVIGCPFFSGSTDFNKFMWATVRYAVPKRSNVAPTVYLSSGTSGQWTYETSAGVVNAAPTFYSNATTSFSLYLTAGTVAYTVARCFGHWVTNAEL
jgi:hypothetical protein